MKKHFFKHFVLAIAACCVVSCQDSEGDLLKQKVYFENSLQNVTMPDTGTTLDVDITSRLSNKQGADVEVSYTVADSSLVAAYNSKYGTDYIPFKAADATFSKASSSIAAGEIYAGKVSLTLSKLDQLKEGKSYMLPLRLHSGSAPVISGEDIAYVVLAKPVKIAKAGDFYNKYISVKFPAGTYFKSFTYEALINSIWWGNNCTVMGSEGIMILRVGDVGGGISSGILQAAGRQHYEAPEKLQINKWYHVALTFDQATGKTVMYLNGVKWAESAWNISGFDPNADVGFNIGKIPGFPWGERPFYGYMSEVRVWSVARTENQIKQNMLSVDPKSDGLELYFKMNGSETVTGNKIKDSAKGLECTTGGLEFTDLTQPITHKDLQ